MLHFAKAWDARLAQGDFARRPIFKSGGLVWGFGTVLMPLASDRFAVPSARDDNRLIALLAIAHRDRPHPDSVPLLKAALADWRGGDRAMASIRLAFAPGAKLASLEDAHRLFLAEKALDAGLDAARLLEEFRLSNVIELLKFDPNQPRVPAGHGRESGRFDSGTPQADAGWADAKDADRSPIVTAFFDEERAKRLKNKGSTTTLPFDVRRPKSFQAPSLGLDEVLPPLPLPFPIPEPEKKEGPSCPPMLPDREHGESPKGEQEEARVALLVNPDGPTPKRTPETPGVTSMAYYLPVPGGLDVAIDDCKRTDAPSLIPEIKKGDMVEVKTEGAARLISQPFAEAGPNFDRQLERQMSAIKAEGKGRSLFVCVDTQKNIDDLTERYKNRDLSTTHFVICR